MSYATDIINIRCDDSAIAEHLKRAFAEGHKQARHAAAEIAAHADDRLEHASTKASDQSLRDWFAGQAIKPVADLWADLDNDKRTLFSGCKDVGIITQRDFPRFVARVSYWIADAMLEARKEAK